MSRWELRWEADIREREVNRDCTINHQRRLEGIIDAGIASGHISSSAIAFFLIFTGCTMGLLVA
jgi:hypothetical protein